jgi:hypothetical protein
MRSSLVVTALVAVAQAQQQLATDSIKVYKGAFGAITEETTTASGVHKNVSFPSLPYAMDYEAQTKNLEYLTSKMNGSFLADSEPLYTCDERLPASDTEVLMFLPVYDAAVNVDRPTATFTGECWDFDITYEQIDESSFDLLINTSNKQSLTCSDNLFIANTEIKHIETFWFSGEHRITLNVPADGQVDLAFGGIKIFHFCGGWIKEIESVLHTLEAFVGGLSDHPLIPFIGSHTPDYMEKANIGFIESGMGITIEERPIYNVDVPENYIQSGDFFVIMRLDGLDPMIMYGTGAHGAHCV